MLSPLFEVGHRVKLARAVKDPDASGFARIGLNLAEGGHRLSKLPLRGLFRLAIGPGFKSIGFQFSQLSVRLDGLFLHGGPLLAGTLKHGGFHVVRSGPKRPA